MSVQAFAWWHKAGINDWAPFPDWALFFLGLGSTIASCDGSPTRAIVAITTPTRAFAAALCAAGVVLGRSTTKPPVDPSVHFAYLKTLPLGTIVSLRPGVAGSKKATGSLHGFVTQGDGEYVVVRIPKRGDFWTPERMAYRVEPVADFNKKLPKHGVFKRMNVNAPFISNLLDPGHADDFIGKSRLDCLVIGNRRVLHDELIEAEFGVSSNRHKRLLGNLQDVVRARVFLPHGDTFHSDVVSLAAKVPPAKFASTPAVAIFDGARSFLRWNRTYPSASWIVVLDRSDRRLIEAIEFIDAMYVSRAGNDSSLTVKDPPIGIECAVFEARSGAA